MPYTDLQSLGILYWLPLDKRGSGYRGVGNIVPKEKAAGPTPVIGKEVEKCVLLADVPLVNVGLILLMEFAKNATRSMKNACASLVGNKKEAPCRGMRLLFPSRRV